jgi:hypothetical protein
VFSAIRDEFFTSILTIPMSVDAAVILNIHHQSSFFRQFPTIFFPSNRNLNTSGPSNNKELVYSVPTQSKVRRS